jgi:hypothetical protein
MKQKERNKPKNDKYKWKLTPPKDGEQNAKKIFRDRQKKVYYWCPHHRMWTKHSPQECKRLPVGNMIKDSKVSYYRTKRKAYIEAKAALMAMSLSSDSEEEQNTDSNDDASQGSVNTEYIFKPIVTARVREKTQQPLPNNPLCSPASLHIAHHSNINSTLF